MSQVLHSAGEPGVAVAAAASGSDRVSTLPLRDAALTISELIDFYMAQYNGRDPTRTSRLDWWRGQIGDLTLGEISDDHLHAALDVLASQPARYYAGKDVDGRAIYKARGARSGATINRYSAAIGAVFTWAIRRRVAPKGFIHPVRGIEMQRESSGKTRFLSDDERTRLLAACKASKWPRLYLLVLLALTTGARRGELVGLRWRDIDLDHKVLHVGHSKNGDPKVLPLVPAVVEELQALEGAPDGLVFPARLQPRHPMAFEDRWQQALKAAGIKGCCFHDLRHSCASLLAANGATLLEIGDLLGHRNITMTKRYSHLAAGHRSALVNRVMGGLR